MFEKYKTNEIFKIYNNILLRDPSQNELESYVHNFNPDLIKQKLLSSDERSKILQSYDNTPLLESPRDLPKNTIIDFWDTDTEDKFNAREKKYGKKWYWFKKKVSYKINKLGYRMKQFEEIDTNNCIAVFGCSHTVGVGINNEDTWSYKIAKNMNCDLINASIPGGSNDLMLINLIKLLKKIKPKLIVMSWTSLLRKSFWNNGNVIMHILNGAIFDKDKIWEPSFNNYVKNDIQHQWEFKLLKDTVDLLCKFANIPVWHITMWDMFSFDKSIEKFIWHKPDSELKPAARDTVHPSIELNNNIYNFWLKRK